MAQPDRPPLSPVRRHLSLRESVTESLRAAIIAGDLKEGTLYSAPSLSAVFGVSATPVREAMMDLTREGLVETVKNKGFRVTRTSESDLDEIIAIRLLLEPPSVGMVVGSVPEAGFVELRALADAIVSAAARQDLPGYLAADREFHAEVLSFLGNRQLVELATSLRMRTRMYGLKSLNENNQLMGSAHEHHQLLDFMENGDSENAVQLMRRHIEHARGLWATGTENTSSEEREL